MSKTWTKYTCVQKGPLNFRMTFGSINSLASGHTAVYNSLCFYWSGATRITKSDDGAIGRCCGIGQEGVGGGQQGGHGGKRFSEGGRGEGKC